MRCAECQPEEAAQHYSEAGNVLRKENAGQAVEYYNRAVEMLASAGRISQAARMRKQIAEIYEADDMYALAAQNYMQAAEFFEMDNTDSTANACKLKAADFFIEDSLTSETIVFSIKIYEEVGYKYLMHNLTKYSAKDCFFKAGLLYLANDDCVGCENAINNYTSRDPSFETSRENGLLLELLSATRAQNTNDFETSIYNFNRITPLDRWKTKVLLKAKSYLNQSDALDFS